MPVFPKNITSLLLLFICVNSWGQFSKYKGTWISSSNDVMIIHDTINKYDNSNMLCTAEDDEGMSFYLLGDTLSFQKRYYSSATNYEKLYINRYDLLVLSVTDSTMSVTPCSKLSKSFFGNRHKLNFTRKEYNRDRSIVFEKIIYHTTSCYGTCPTIDLEIDSNRNIYLSGSFYDSTSMFKKDTAASGNFTGRLNETQYNRLISILQTCNLKTLEFPERMGADAPVTTLIIYYNGQRKYLKSMFPPSIAEELIEFLYMINQNTKLTKTKEKRTIEG
jgi:hypothetical protein